VEKKDVSREEACRGLDSNITALENGLRDQKPRKAGNN
jgi:hypothetical protein